MDDEAGRRDGILKRGRDRTREIQKEVERQKKINLNSITVIEI